MADSGYSLIHWSVKDSLQGGSAESIGLWVYLITSAAIKTQVKRGGFTIERGQVWVSLRALEERLGMSRTTISRYLKLWTEDGSIEVQNMGRKGTILTLCNFDTYQPLGREGGTQSNHKRAKSQPNQNRNQPYTESPKSPKSPEKKGGDAPDPVARVEDERVRDSVRVWLAYKAERREGYKPSGLKALVTRCNKLTRQHGPQAVCDAIDRAMASGWKGFDHGIGDGARGSPGVRTTQSQDATARFLASKAEHGEPPNHRGGNQLALRGARPPGA